MAGNKCSICAHKQRQEVEAAFIRGVSSRAIARQFGVGRCSVLRHILHGARGLLDARRNAVRASGEDLATVAGEALVEARRLLQRAQDADDLRSWGTAITAIQRHVELLAKLEGRIREQTTVVILDSPQWQAVEDRIFAALESEPRARNLVARALLQVSEGAGSEP